VILNVLNLSPFRFVKVSASGTPFLHLIELRA
jgi:hypothetical protein